MVLVLILLSLSYLSEASFSFFSSVFAATFVPAFGCTVVFVAVAPSACFATVEARPALAASVPVGFARVAPNFFFSSGF